MRIFLRTAALFWKYWPRAIIAYFYLKETEAVIPYILAISAASFIYIATADLIPMLHKKAGFKVSAGQFVLLLAGIGTILLFQH
jgi:zinc and cadmium transporter